MLEAIWSYDPTWSYLELWKIGATNQYEFCRSDLSGMVTHKLVDVWKAFGWCWMLSHKCRSRGLSQFFARDLCMGMDHFLWPKTKPKFSLLVLSGNRALKPQLPERGWTVAQSLCPLSSCWKSKIKFKEVLRSVLKYPVGSGDKLPKTNRGKMLIEQVLIKLSPILLYVQHLLLPDTRIYTR